MRKLEHEEIPRLQPDNAADVQRHPIVAVADNVRSIHNVGSFFRSADGAWIEKMYLTGITGTPANRALHKTALGAQDTVPWSHDSDITRVLTALKKQGYRIVSLELTDSPTLVDDLDASHFPLALVVGNELTGVQPDVLALTDYALEIPQYGTKQSLNVSVAFGIALFDLVRLYRTSTGVPLLADPFARPSAE